MPALWQQEGGAPGFGVFIQRIGAGRVEQRRKLRAARRIFLSALT
jgi:hypothetical protein